ncbi:putative HTH-type transcriptional regulator [Pandoraea horticolens]|uniref:Putative HTH-type transcriptional regulator n=1 Tax=Pandoraea horticolens TaxID=2508298 RepID=A0A5E4SK31_9BURK|nr:S24 family peptidase [Pandoraea horticolens]VVD74598.1 putative HTH-type transcriptional regulator [Pandoraea horticolens]
MTMNIDNRPTATRAYEGLAQRISALLDEAGIAPEALEETVGAAPGTTAKWFSGELPDIGHDQAARIQEAYGFNMFWLITGKGNRRIPSLIGPGQKPVPKYLNSYRPESFAARLHYAMSLRGVRQKSDIAEAGGISPSAVALWFSGSTEEVEDEKVITLANFLRVEPAWLRDGTGPMERPMNVRPAEVGKRRIPLISSVQAGLMHETVTPFPAGDAFEYLLTDLDLSDSAFALEIEGRSMEPDFREGDRILVDPTVRPIAGDFVVATNGRDEATFKTYQPRGTSTEGIEIFALVPLNPDYPTISNEREPVRIVGVMVEHRRYRRR